MSGAALMVVFAGARNAADADVAWVAGSSGLRWGGVAYRYSRYAGGATRATLRVVGARRP